MNASALRAAIHIINRANKQFGLDLKAPVDFVEAPGVYEYKGVVYSAIDGDPIILAGHYITFDRAARDLRVGGYVIPREKDGWLCDVRNMTIHALNGADTTLDIIMCIIRWARQANRTFWRRNGTQVSSMVDQLRRETALRAEIAALRAELAKCGATGTKN